MNDTTKCPVCGNEPCTCQPEEETEAGTPTETPETPTE